MNTATVVFLLTYGALVGWGMRDAWLDWTARRAIRRMMALHAAQRQRESRARWERHATWHVDADSPDEAWNAFHAVAQIGGRVS
jgi:hypothetical protein